MATSPSERAQIDDALGLRQLTARSVILSLLLGSRPPRLPVRTLVQIAELFGISDGTVRVALSRMTSEGDVRAEDGVYELSERLVQRQRRQDEARRPPTRDWSGEWEMAVLRPGERPDTARDALGELRLAELAPGCWVRPANLGRPWPPEVSAWCHRFTARPDGNPAALAAGLWDLTGRAAQGEALLAALADAGSPARRFTVSAAVLRHLRDDPLLPEELLPTGWPAERLRAAYREFEAELATLLREGPKPATGDDS